MPVVGPDRGEAQAARIADQEDRGLRRMPNDQSVMDSQQGAASEAILPRGPGSEIVADRAYPPPMRRRAFALSILLALAGCASDQAPIPPVYTQDELRAQCERHHGWWRAGGLREEFCEFDSQM